MRSCHSHSSAWTIPALMKLKELHQFLLSRTCAAQSKASLVTSSWEGWGTRTWQDEDVHEGFAVIETCRHDAVCPQPLGSQLIHFPAGGNGVAASHHPVVGGCCHNHPDPPDKAADKSSQVQAGGHHVDPLVGQAGQESTRSGSAKLLAAGTYCKLRAGGTRLGGMRSLLRQLLQALARLSLPSFPPWEGLELPPAP